MKIVSTLKNLKLNKATTSLVSVFSKIPSGIFILTLVYWLVFVLMLPLYNSVTRDDFASILSVKYLVVDGVFKVHDWAAMSLVGQMFWGALFAYIFGFSVVVLKVSVVILLYCGLLSFYLLLRELKINNFYSTISVLTFLGIPWTLLFGYTFNTDVPFLSYFLISLYFYIRGFNRTSCLSLIVASVFASLSFLTRQTGIVLPISAGAALIFVSFLKKKRLSHLLIISSLLIPLLTFLSYIYWLKVGSNQTIAQHYYMDKGLVPALKSLWPTALTEIGTTSRLYSSMLNRIGYYMVQVIGVTWPGIILAGFHKDLFKSLQHKSFLFLCVFIFVLLSFCVLLQPSMRLSLQLDNLYTPREFFYIAKVVKILTAETVRKIWTFAVIGTFPLFVLIITKSISFLFSYFFSWKLRFSVNKLGVLLLLFHVFFASFLVYYTSKLAARYPLTDALQDVWLFALINYMFFLFLILSFSGVSFKKLDDKFVKYVVLTVSFLSILFWTLVIPFSWVHYTIPFLPFSIILIAFYINIHKANRLLAVFIVIAMVSYSYLMAKSDLTINGAIWETGNKLVSQGISPVDVGTDQWYWYPYWYYQQRYDDLVKSFGGDKKKVGVFLEEPNLTNTKYYIDVNAPFDSETKVGCVDNFLASTKFTIFKIDFNFRIHKISGISCAYKQS